MGIQPPQMAGAAIPSEADPESVMTGDARIDTTSGKPLWSCSPSVCCSAGSSPGLWVQTGCI